MGGRRKKKKKRPWGDEDLMKCNRVDNTGDQLEDAEVLLLQDKKTRRFHHA